MDFSIVTLLDEEKSRQWLRAHFHPRGQHCPHCGASREEAREFRQTGKSRLQVYRCTQCEGVYNLYSGTILEGTHWRPEQVVWVLRGITQGTPATKLARELGVCRQTVQSLRQQLQVQAESLQPETALEDQRTETDEMFQNAGEKRRTPS